MKGPKKYQLAVRGSGKHLLCIKQDEKWSDIFHTYKGESPDVAYLQG